MPAPHNRRRAKITLSDNDIRDWIDNDEGLYNWWIGCRQTKSQFIREERAAIVPAIKNIIEGREPASYLAYQSKRRAKQEQSNADQEHPPGA